MRSSILSRFLLLLFIALTLLQCPVLQAQSYGRMWREIEKARRKDLPATVLSLSEELMVKARRDGKRAELLKAMLLRDSAREAISPDSLETDIRHLEAMSREKGLQPLEKAVLGSLLMGRYAEYLTSRSWLLGGQSALAPDSDLPYSALSPSMLFDMAVQSMRLSLEDPELLHQSRNAAWIPLVEQEREGGYFGHDLYHLLLDRALGVLERISFVGDRAREAAGLRRGLLHQAVSQYRAWGCPEASVLMYLDEWAQTRDGRTDGASLLLLDSLLEASQSLEVLPEVYLARAGLLEGMDRCAEALESLEEGLRSPSGRYYRLEALRQMRDRLLCPALSVSVPQVAYPGDTLRVAVTFRNLSRLRLGLFSTSLDGYSQEISKEQLERLRGPELVEQTFLLAPSKAGASLQMRDTVLSLALPPSCGAFLLEVLPLDVSARKEALRSHLSPVYLSRLGTLTLNSGQGSTLMAVVDRKSGRPLPMARLRLEKDGPDRDTLTAVTDSDGLARLRPSAGGWKLTVQADGDRFLPPSRLYASSGALYQKERRTPHVILLTDRSLYRPGDTVRFKGVAYESEGLMASVEPGRKATVRMLDAGGTEVGRMALTASSMGSFWGSLPLPSSCLPGLFRLEVEDGASARTFRVESYVRPSFQIRFDDWSRPPLLGDTVRLSGSVTTYSGMPLAGARLLARLSGGSGLRNGSGILLSDTLLSDSQGRFRLDLVVSEMRMEITVEATDRDGSTISARQLLISSSRRYYLEHDLGDVVIPASGLSFHFRLRSADGKPQEAPLRISWLAIGKDEPMEVAQRDLLGRPAAFSCLLERGQELPSQALSRLPSGGYEVVTEDPDGVVLDRTAVQLVSEGDLRLRSRLPLLLHPLRGSFSEQAPSRILLATGPCDGTLYLTRFSQTDYLDTRVIPLSGDEVRILEIPYEPRYQEGLTLTATLVRDQKMYTRMLRIEKEHQDHRLSTSWLSMRDRTSPGAREQWSLQLTLDGKPLEGAEMLAVLYDAALDDLYPLRQTLSFRPSLTFASSAWRMEAAGRSFYSFPFSWKMRPVPERLRDRFFEAEAGMDYPRPLIRRSEAVMAGRTVSLAKANAASPQDAATGDEQTEASPILPREDFSSLGLFNPSLLSDSLGVFHLDFRAPELLSRWRLRAYIHTREMNTLMVDTVLVTQKALSVEVSMPRFAYQGDSLRLPLTLTNRTDRTSKARVVLRTYDLETGKSLNRQVLSLEMAPMGRMTVEVPLFMPSGHEMMGLEAVATSGEFSDGERHALVLLEPRQRLTLAVPLRMDQKGSRTWSLDTLMRRDGLRSLTLEYASNTSWYALEALSSLRRAVSGNALDLAGCLASTRLLLGLLASDRNVALELRRLYGQDGGTEAPAVLAMSSPDLDAIRGVLMEETPWVSHRLEASRSLEEAMDPDRLAGNLESAARALSRLQGPDGAWRWYEGMTPSLQVTLRVALVLQRAHLSVGGLPPSEEGAWVALLEKMRSRAMDYLDRKAGDFFRQQMRLASSDRARSLPQEWMDYLYLRLLQGRLEDRNDEVLGYLTDLLPRSAQAMPQMGDRARLAVLLWNLGRRNEARGLLESLREHLVRDDQGVHLDRLLLRQSSRLELSVHLDLMEALSLENGDGDLWDGLRTFLILEKRDGTWTWPDVTFRAASVLLGDGTVLAGDSQDLLRLNGDGLSRTVRCAGGMGYVHLSLPAWEASRLKSLTLEKASHGVSLGAVYLDWLAEYGALKDGSPSLTGLRIERNYFRILADSLGRDLLVPLREGEPVRVGDRLVSRLLVRADRASDFVVLKDPVNAALQSRDQLSGYRRYGALGCYRAPGTASVSFFIDRLPKGDFVIEHTFDVTRAGTFQTGAPTLESLYSPQMRAYGHQDTLRVE